MLLVNAFRTILALMQTKMIDYVFSKRKIEQSEQLVSVDTINKIKDLMYNVVNSDDPGATGKNIL